MTSQQDGSSLLLLYRLQRRQQAPPLVNEMECDVTASENSSVIVADQANWWVLVCRIAEMTCLSAPPPAPPPNDVLILSHSEQRQQQPSEKQKLVAQLDGDTGEISRGRRPRAFCRTLQARQSRKKQWLPPAVPCIINRSKLNCAPGLSVSYYEITCLGTYCGECTSSSNMNI